MWTVVSRSINLLPAATKLGQGNIFRSVCQEFCPQGEVWSGPWGLQIFGGVGGWGVSKFSGGLQFFRGGFSKFFFLFFFNFFSPPKIPSGMHQPLPPPRRSIRGRYASYWNAFLLRRTSVHYVFIDFFINLAIHHKVYDWFPLRDKSIPAKSLVPATSHISCVYLLGFFLQHKNW